MPEQQTYNPMQNYGMSTEDDLTPHQTSKLTKTLMKRVMLKQKAKPPFTHRKRKPQKWY